MTNITVLGAGKWGTALGQALACSGNAVTLWDADAAIVKDIVNKHENRKHHPGIHLHENVTARLDLAEALVEAQMVFVCLPAHVQTEVAVEAAPLLRKNMVLVQASAGLRQTDGAVLTTVWQEVVKFDLQLVALAGPNLAVEVMEQKYTAFVLAGPDAGVVKQVAQVFKVPYLRPYLGDDLTGVQLGAAVRSILAISAGMCDGMDLGTNVRAAMLCRGLHELARLAVAMGAKERTMYGLAGMGDILLNATTPLSRNYRLGKLLAEGQNLDKALKQIGTVDGIVNARMVTYLANSYGLDLAIIAAVDGVLNGDINPKEAVQYLMQRPVQNEF